VVQSLTLPPGGTTGWHRHPGDAIFVINSGTGSQWGLNGPACERVALVDGKCLPRACSQRPCAAHLVKIEGADTATATVIYFNVPPGEQVAYRAEAPAECPELS